MLPCGRHRCPARCHADECPPCRIRVKKTCRLVDCGNGVVVKCFLKTVSLRVYAVSSVLLSPVLFSLIFILFASVSCGRVNKEVMCSEESLCDRKCQINRNCGRHQCRRKYVLLPHFPLSFSSFRCSLLTPLFRKAYIYIYTSKPFFMAKDLKRERRLSLERRRSRCLLSVHSNVVTNFVCTVFCYIGAAREKTVLRVMKCAGAAYHVATTSVK